MCRFAVTTPARGAIAVLLAQMAAAIPLRPFAGQHELRGANHRRIVMRDLQSSQSCVAASIRPQIPEKVRPPGGRIRDVSHSRRHHRDSSTGKDPGQLPGWSVDQGR